MNEPTTENVEAMISFLADKTLSFGCMIYLKEIFNRDERNKHARVDKTWYSDRGGNRVGYIAPSETCGWGHTNIKDVKIIGHPVMIGDVLCKMDFAFNWDTLGDWSKIIKLIRLWFPLRLNKSLNEILGGEVAQVDNAPVSGNEEYKTWVVFLDNNIQSLWELLVKLFPNYKQ